MMMAPASLSSFFFCTNFSHAFSGPGSPVVGSLEVRLSCNQMANIRQQWRLILVCEVGPQGLYDWHGSQQPLLILDIGHVGDGRFLVGMVAPTPRDLVSTLVSSANSPRASPSSKPRPSSVTFGASLSFSASLKTESDRSEVWSVGLSADRSEVWSVGLSADRSEVWSVGLSADRSEVWSVGLSAVSLSSANGGLTGLVLSKPTTAAPTASPSLKPTTAAGRTASGPTVMG
jgi:hypothetical protein